MFGRIIIYVDSEIVTSFVGDMEQWRRRAEFNIPRNPLLQQEVGRVPAPQLETLKTISLKIHATLHGNLIGEPYLCLFCYNYDDPTQKQMYLDVCMARGQMRNML